MTTWLEDVIQALENLGGEARLNQIYEEVKMIRTEPLPRTYEASIRGVLERHSSDSLAFSGKDVFRKAGFGIWALRSLKSDENQIKHYSSDRVKRKQTQAYSSLISPDNEPQTWVEDIIQALRNLGGQGQLNDIYEEVCRIRTAPIPPNGINVTASRIISYSSDSPSFLGRADIFAKVGDGVWALRDLNVDFHEAVGRGKRKSHKLGIRVGSKLKDLGGLKVSIEEIENIHNTIQQYREYTNPGSIEWEGYIMELFNVLGFTAKEHARLSNGAGKEFPVWFVSPMEVPEKYVSVLGVIKKEYPFDEFLPNIPLSIILDAHRGLKVNKRNDIVWVIITDGNRMRIIDYRKSKVGQISYENLNLDEVITQVFNSSFLELYEKLELIRFSPS